jgi:hypothetical protein
MKSPRMLVLALGATTREPMSPWRRSDREAIAGLNETGSVVARGDRLDDHMSSRKDR